MRKVGIMSMQRIANYGSFLQAYRDNPKNLKQDGAFIISGLDASDKEDFGCDGTKECYHMIKMVGYLKILKRILFTILVEC